MAHDDELLLLPEAAAFLKRPETTLYAWRWRRQGPPSFKQGRLVCYWKSDLLQWLIEQQAAEPRYVTSSEPKPARRQARPVTKQATAKRTGRKGAA